MINYTTMQDGSIVSIWLQGQHGSIYNIASNATIQNNVLRVFTQTGGMNSSTLHLRLATKSIYLTKQASMAIKSKSQHMQVLTVLVIIKTFTSKTTSPRVHNIYKGDIMNSYLHIKSQLSCIQIKPTLHAHTPIITSTI